MQVMGHSGRRSGQASLGRCDIQAEPRRSQLCGCLEGDSRCKDPEVGVAWHVRGGEETGADGGENGRERM